MRKTLRRLEGSAAKGHLSRPRYRAATAGLPQLADGQARLADHRQSDIAAGVVDDLQHALGERGILDGELGTQAAVVEEVGRRKWPPPSLSFRRCSYRIIGMGRGNPHGSVRHAGPRPADC